MEATALWQGALQQIGWLIGWALIHLLWQGTLLGIFYAVGRALLPRGEVRYRYGMGILLAFGLCPLLTVWRLCGHAMPTMATATGLVVPGTAEHGDTWNVAFVSSFDFDRVLPWLVLSWCCGVLLLSLRAWWQWRGLKALLRRASELAPWQDLVTTMSWKFGLRRRVRVLCSDKVAAPLLLGWIRPVILLPLAVICNFPVAQVELILAHELAHLRRWDPLANLFQVILETLYFFHPVVHWISRDVRNEREICCDRLALEITGGSRQQLAWALADLCELNERQTSLVLAANGGVVLDRVQQLAFSLPARPSRQATRLGRFAAIALATAMAIVLLGFEWRLMLLQRGLMDSLQRLQSTVLPVWSPLLDTFRVKLTHDLVIVHARGVRAAPVLAAAPDTPPAVDSSITLPSPSTRWQVAPIQVDDLVARQPRSVAKIPVIAVNTASINTLPVDTVESPVPVQIQQPTYPQAALERGVEGSVVLEFGLSPDGSVENVRVIDAKPVGVFDKAATDAFRQWKYRVPSQFSEQARFRQSVSFTLQDHANEAGSHNNIHARVGCNIVTGTHICRLPEEPGALTRNYRQ